MTRAAAAKKTAPAPRRRKRVLPCETLCTYGTARKEESDRAHVEEISQRRALRTSFIAFAGRLMATLEKIDDTTLMAMAFRQPVAASPAPSHILHEVEYRALVDEVCQRLTDDVASGRVELAIYTDDGARLDLSTEHKRDVLAEVVDIHHRGAPMPTTTPGGFLPKELASIKVAVGDADGDGKVDVSVAAVLGGRELPGITVNLDLGSALALFGAIRSNIFRVIGR